MNEEPDDPVIVTVKMLPLIVTVVPGWVIVVVLVLVAYKPNPAAAIIMRMIAVTAKTVVVTPFLLFLNSFIKADFVLIIFRRMPKSSPNWNRSTDLNFI